MFAALIEWLNYNSVLFGWLGLGSFLMFLGSLIAAPMIVARLPHDYFVRQQRGPLREHKRLRAFFMLWLVLKNILGALFVLAGIAMLILPGQGILTIFVGALLIDGPYKREFVLWLVSRKRILKSLNWLRRNNNKPPFVIYSGQIKTGHSEEK